MGKIYFKNSYIFYVLTIVSLCLYFIAPEYPSLVFQILCFIIFSLQAVVIIKHDLRLYGLLNFNLLFLISFFLVTYAFPLFLMTSTMADREGIEAFIDFNVSSKCSALCTFAISVYCLSYSKYRKRLVDFSTIVKVESFPLVNILFYIITIALYLVTQNHIRLEGGVAVDSGYLYSLYLAILPLALVQNCKKNKVRSALDYICANFFVLVPAMIMIFLYLIIGDRGLVIISGFMIIAIYGIMVKKISPVFLIIGIITGTILMYVLRETRSTEASLIYGNTKTFAREAENISSNASVLTVFSDLTGIHRELYIGYDYVQHKGYVEPAQIIVVPFYPLPLLPNFISQTIFGKSYNEIKPGPILNDYMAYSGHGHFGIHCVIDIYMRWGVIGVLIVFYLWGYVISSISVQRKKNLIAMVLYVTIIASAISFPRKPLLDSLRIIAYIIFLAWISGLFTKKKYLTRCVNEK